MLSLTRLAPLTLAAALSLSLAGCGGSSNNPGKASAGNSGPGAGVQTAYKFSTCMRNHGVANFPDPKVSSNGNSTQIAIAVNPSITGNKAFKSAQKACASILPAPNNANNGANAAQVHQHEEDLLSFASCMRAHGVSTFPDPTAQGQITPQMLSAAHLDWQSPAFDKSAYTCVPASHGILTAAQVRQAIATNGQPQSTSSGSGGPGPAGNS